LSLTKQQLRSLVDDQVGVGGFRGLSLAIAIDRWAFIHPHPSSGAPTSSASFVCALWSSMQGLLDSALHVDVTRSALETQASLRARTGTSGPRPECAIVRGCQALAPRPRSTHRSADRRRDGAAILPARCGGQTLAGYDESIDRTVVAGRMRMENWENRGVRSREKKRNCKAGPGPCSAGQRSPVSSRIQPDAANTEDAVKASRPTTPRSDALAAPDRQLAEDQSGQRYVRHAGAGRRAIARRVLSGPIPVP